MKKNLMAVVFMKTIAIIDDDVHIGNMVEEVLHSENYNVIRAYSGTEALYLLSNNKPDLILLDLMLPGISGEDVLPHIQNIPVIVISSIVDVDSKVNLLLSGAADYLTKPFNILELKARIRALLRRSAAGKPAQAKTLTIGPITLDLDARNAYRSGQLVDLTAKEFDVIEFLMRNANRVYSRESLLDSIWAYEYRSDIRTLDVHIRRLREKLEENPAQPKYIMTKWGVGYYFRKEEK